MLNRLSLNYNLDSIRFALFLACMNGLYKAVLCMMRRFSKNDKINASVAGFISGLSIIIDSKNRRMFIMLLLLSRAM